MAARDRGVSVPDFNSYGAPRGNHEVMVRGTFANVRIRNLMVPDVEGGVTRHQPGGERMGIYDAAERCGPCQLPEGVNVRTMGLDGTERYGLELDAPVRPRQAAALHIEHSNGRRQSVPLLLRIDTPIEAAYFAAGGILPHVFEHLLSQGARREATP